MEYLYYFRDRMLIVMGGVSFAIFIVVYLIMAYMMLNQHMTFFDEGQGDLMIFSLFSCLALLQFTLFFVARKHQLKWLYLPVILITAGFLVAAPRGMHSIQGQDHRSEQLKDVIPSRRSPQ